MGLDNMIKAWDKEENQMCYVVFIDFIKPQIGLHCIGYGSYCQHLNDVIILRNTEVKDKNSKEIYEGSIIEGGYLNPLTNEFLSRKYLIEYKDGCFIGSLIGHSPYGDTWLRFIKGEVIGNRYENPELLEG